MKSAGCSIGFLALLLLMISFAQSQPVLEEINVIEYAQTEQYELEQLPPTLGTNADIYSRPKRATCDLLSYFNVNHSACAANCVLQGRKGGYCNSQAVCVCRN